MPSGGTIKVYCVSPFGSGTADYVTLPRGSTILDLLEEVTGGGDPDNFVIRFKGNTVSGGNLHTTLRGGDRVTISPTKHDGAKN